MACIFSIRDTGKIKYSYIISSFVIVIGLYVTNEFNYDNNQLCIPLVILSSSIASFIVMFSLYVKSSKLSFDVFFVIKRLLFFIPTLTITAFYYNVDKLNVNTIVFIFFISLSFLISLFIAIKFIRGYQI